MVTFKYKWQKAPDGHDNNTTVIVLVMQGQQVALDLESNSMGGT